MSCCEGAKAVFMEFLTVLFMQLFLLPLLVTSSFLPNNCPSECGGIGIEYPFGIGDGCFRPGFELTCDYSTNPPQLFLGNDTTFQVNYFHFDSSGLGYIDATTGVTIMPSNVENYTVIWTPPNPGQYIFQDGYNTLNIIGCGIFANLTDTNVVIGQCAAFCDSHQALAEAHGATCANIGCCQIQIPASLQSYELQLTRVKKFNQLNEDLDAKAFISSKWHFFDIDELYYSYRFNATTRVDLALLWSIPDTLSCEVSKEQNDSYACLAKDSYCTNFMSLGYYCTCLYLSYRTELEYEAPGNSVSSNPYIPGGCGDAGSENITQPSLECRKNCGKIDIPFPFGLTKGCYRNPDFAVFCNETAEPETLLFGYYSNGMNIYQVDEILIEEGKIRVDTVQETFKERYTDDKPLLYYNESALFNWAIDYITCDQAMKNMSTYACISNHSSCVTKVMKPTGNQVGYHCNCSQGYEGNPYLAHGCKDINECLHPEKYCLNGSCQNFDGGYICCHSGTFVDPISKLCVPQHKPRNLAAGFYIGLGFGIGLICLLLILGLIFCKRVLDKRIQKKLRKKYFHQNHGLLLQQLISCNGDTAEKTKIFTFEELEKATSNFDPSRIVGRGGHGTVFKGLLSDQRVVAIKKSKLIVKREIDQFINEVVILSRINHRNIVKLFGCCLETEVPLLVYEFISSGTLHNHLHATNLKSTLSWEDRLQIASQTAGALSYLHSAASISIFHRDVKSANILLDEYLTAKVSDFGASRLIPIDQTQVATGVQGTYGYLDPEYHHTGQLTEKSDVYSFGVILVELLTGELPISSSRVEEERNLSVHFLRAIKDNRILDIIEARVKEESTTNELDEFVHLAEICLRLKGAERPTMKEVEFELQSLRMRKQQNEAKRVQHGNERSNSSIEGQSIIEPIVIPFEDHMIGTSGNQSISLLTCPR